MAIKKIGNTLPSRGPITFFDVGANVGRWSLAAVSEIPSTIRLYAFEPVHETFLELQRVLAHNRFSGMATAIEAALGDSEGAVPIYIVGEGGTTTVVLFISVMLRDLD